MAEVFIEILRVVWIPSSHKHPLTRQCMKLWDWSQTCNEKPGCSRGEELRKLWKGTTGREENQPRYTMWSAASEVPMEHSQAFGTYTVSMAQLCPVFWTAVFADWTSALSRYWFHPILPRLRACGNGMLMPRYRFLKVYGLLLASTKAHSRLAEDFQFRRFINTRSDKSRWFSKINHKHFLNCKIYMNCCAGRMENITDGNIMFPMDGVLRSSVRIPWFLWEVKDSLRRKEVGGSWVI